MSAFPKKCLYLPKFLMTFFSHRPFSRFNVLFFRWGGAKSVADIDTGWAKIPTFRQIDNAIITLSAPEGGPNSIDNFDGVAMAGFAPWIRHCRQIFWGMKIENCFREKDNENAPRLHQGVGGWEGSTHPFALFDPHVLYCIVLYSNIYTAPLNSHRQTEALLVRLAPRKETSFKK